MARSKQPERFAVPEPVVTLAFPARELEEAIRAHVRGWDSPLKGAVAHAFDSLKPDLDLLVAESVRAVVESPEWRVRLQAEIECAIKSALIERVRSRVSAIGASFVVKALHGKEAPDVR